MIEPGVDLGTSSGGPPPSQEALDRGEERVQRMGPELVIDELEALKTEQAERVLFVPSTEHPSGLLAYPDAHVPSPAIIYSGSFNPLHEVGLPALSS
jgi:hypothetical protein